MREIKFKAQRELDGGWVYGYTFTDGEKYFIRWMHNPRTKDFTDLEVLPNTICQYTGLQDKNGKDIYEGDICWTYEIGIGSVNREVFFDYGSFTFRHESYLDLDLKYTKKDYREVTGNIHNQ